MIAGLFAFAGIAIDCRPRGVVSHRFGHECEVNAHSPTPMKRAVAIIPPRIDAWFGVLFAHHITQAPVGEGLQARTLGGTHMGRAFECFGVPDIGVGRCNVVVTCHHQVVGGFGNRCHVRRQSIHPAEFVLIVLVVKGSPIGHIHRHHRHTTAVGSDDASFVIGLTHHEVVAHIGEPGF